MDSQQSIIKQMPYSLEAEQALLGAILTSPELMNETAGLKSEDFYLEQHQFVFAAMLDLSLESKSIDLVTVINALERSGAYKGPDAARYVKLLVDMAAYSGNIKDYIDIIKDKAILRRLIEVSHSIADDAFSQTDTVDIILDSAEQKLFDIANNKYNASFVHIREAIKQNYDLLGILKDNPNGVPGIRTNFDALDRYLVRLSPGDLVLIGARPGMGKTTFCMNIAANMAKSINENGVPPEIAVFSLEMTPQQLVSRMLSAESLVNHDGLRTGKLTNDEWEKLAVAASTLSKTNILIDDTASITVMGMRSKLRRLKNLKAVIIDYLQLMHADKNIESRVLEIADITRGLKLMAKDLGVPIILCSQLKREQNNGEKTEKKRPQLSDLRDSGAIEQDADVVLFLHRSSYGKYGETEGGNASQLEITECIVAKNRHGSTGIVKMSWYAPNYRFVSIDNTYAE